MTTFAERWAGRAASIATFGDSITQALHIDPPRARWANRLATAISARLDNRGISGTVLQRSADAGGGARPDNGRSLIDQWLGGTVRTDLVAILYGTNDARYVAAPATLNPDGYVRDYRQILGDLLAAGFAPEAIIIGSPIHISDMGLTVGSDGFAGQSRVEFQRYVRTVEMLAREFGTYYAPVNERMGAEGADVLISDDHIHPNQVGHAKIAEAFAGAVLATDRFLK